MRASRYNHFFEIEGDIILAFNSASGALAEIERVHYGRILELIRNPQSATTSSDKEFMEALVQGGYLVEGDNDEVAGLRGTGHSNRKQGNSLMLTIAPTLACNFRCDYCFETQTRGKMDDRTMQALLRFSESHMSDAKNLILCWFGGEPTLCMDIIGELQEKLLLMAQRYDVTAEPASIITNGYLLNAQTARRLKDIGIGSAQVTLDGPQEIHDGRRKLHSGKGTYKKILDNICESAGIIHIAVRINVDRGNVESAYEVIEELEQRGILGKVNAHFARVGSPGGSCADIRDRCFNDEEFSHNLVKLYGKLFEKGIYQIDYPDVCGGIYCGAVSERAFVISPKGYLFKCWEELSDDPAKSIGSVFGGEPEDYQKENLRRFRDWDVFKMSQCRECDILPICMGGCPIQVIGSGHEDIGACLPWKYNLKEMLEMRYLSRQMAQQAGPG